MSTVTSCRFSSVSVSSSSSSSSKTRTSCNTPSKPAPTPPRAPTGHSGQSTFEPTPTGASTAPVKGGRTEQQALTELNALLNPAANKKANGATVTANAPGVEKDYSKKSLAKFSEQVRANAPLEQQRLAGLSSKHRKHYEAVKSAVLERASHPVAALALQKLLFEGKLPGAQDFTGQGTVLEHLASAAKGEQLDRRVDRDTFLCDLVQELATPSAIGQGNRGTCAPTSLAIDLAIKHPAEYARLMEGVASKDGTVTLADGKTTLKREAETDFTGHKSNRALTQRLLAPPFMEIANGKREYNDKTGKGDGASASGLDILHDAVYGRNMAYETVSNDKDRTRVMERMDRELASGQNVMVGLVWGSGGHKVLVTGTERIEGQDYVKYINPWGREERMARSEFRSRLRGINYDPAEAAKSVSPTPARATREPVASGGWRSLPATQDVFVHA